MEFKKALGLSSKNHGNHKEVEPVTVEPSAPPACIASKSGPILPPGPSKTNHGNNSAEKFSRKLKNSPTPTVTTPTTTNPLGRFATSPYLSGYGNEDNISVISSSATTAWFQE